MGLKIAVCPSCGKETKLNEEREINFCMNCGNKIVNTTKTQAEDVKNSEESNKTNNGKSLKRVSREEASIEEKLEEVAFYYEMSAQKKEARNAENKEPIFYLKAQEALRKILQDYPESYKAWWELAKPIDFYCPIEDKAVRPNDKINIDFFDKALDYAPLEEKKRIIKEMEEYEGEKELIVEEWKKRYKEKEEEQIEKRIEEQKRVDEEREKIEEQSIALRERLWKGNVQCLDGLSFRYMVSEVQEICFVFRHVSRMLHLFVFNYNRQKNVIYLEQSLAVKFDDFGRVLRYGSGLLRMKNRQGEVQYLQISESEEHSIEMNGIRAEKDEEYNRFIFNNAKKAIVSLKKILY